MIEKRPEVLYNANPRGCVIKTRKQKGEKMGQKYVLTTIVVALIIGFCAGYMCKCNKPKIAVVDLTAIVGRSQQVQALKNEQLAKAKEIALWLENVQNDLKAEQNEEKQKELLQKYNEEFVAKKEEIQEHYAKELKAADESITKTIADAAKKKGYKLVLAKGFTIYGGDDITEEIAKIIK